MSKLMTAVLAALTILASAAAHAPPALADEGEVDLLLVLASDVSRSVDDRKHRLQRDGYAAAIVDPRVVRAMMAGPVAHRAVLRGMGKRIRAGSGGRLGADRQ